MRLAVDAVAVDLSGRRIVNEVTLQIGSGEVVGLIGPNGSGKSTLLRSIYRMLRPAADYVRLGDHDVWQLSARESARRTGVVVQETPATSSSRWPKWRRWGGRRTRVCWRLIRWTMHGSSPRRYGASTYMASFAERQFNTLSGGEKQRVLVARALAQQPKFLVLDEPTNHLDIHYQLEILELVRSLGITTLITLHDLNLAAAYCQRLYLLRAGQIVASGAPEAVLTPELLREVFLVDAVCGRHPDTDALQLVFVPVLSPQSEAQ